MRDSRPHSALQSFTHQNLQIQIWCVKCVIRKMEERDVKIVDYDFFFYV